MADTRKENDSTFPSVIREDVEYEDEEECAEETTYKVVDVDETMYKVIDEEGEGLEDGEIVDQQASEEEENTVELQDQFIMSTKNEDVNVTHASEDVKNQSAFKSSENAGLYVEDNEEGLNEVGAAQTERVDKFAGHPYKYLLLNYNPSAYTSKPPKYSVMPIDKTPCVHINTKADLQELAKQLLLEKEIGVATKDSAKTYKTRLCYLLISTKTKNYMIDCLGLEDSLHVLNDLFTSLDVVKVVHTMRKLSALQLYNLWLVNVFDLQAAFQKLSWKKETYGTYVEKHFHSRQGPYISMDAWHVRPLPESYQRDAIIRMHYVIHLYYKLKQMLIECNLLENMLEWCNQRCGKLHNSNLGTLDHLYPNIRYFPVKQVAVLIKLDAWRHGVGKQLNLHVQTILHSDKMLQLATTMSTKVVDIIRIADSVHAENHVNKIQKIIRSCERVIGPMDKKPMTKKQPKPANRNPVRNQHHSGFVANPIIIAPIHLTQLGALNTQSKPFNKPQAGQFGNPVKGPIRQSVNNHFRNRQNNYLKNPGNPQYPNQSVPFGKRSNTRWDGGPSPKKPKTASWSNQQSMSAGRSPSPPRPSSPTSYMLVSNKGEVIPVDEANIVSSLLGNSRSHTGGSSGGGGGGGGGDRRSNDGPSWGPMNNSSQPSDTMNCLNTLLNLSSALVTLSKLNMPRADHGNNDSHRQNQGGWMDNSSHEWRNRRESPHSIAPPSVQNHRVNNLRSYGQPQSSYRLPNVNLPRRPNVFKYVRPQFPNVPLKQRYSSSRRT